MSVITLTLNPAFDIHAQCEEFQKDRENLALSPVRIAGGKGINIARAFLSLGYRSRNICVLAKENGDEFSAAALSDGVVLDTLTRPGRIRENLTLHTAGGRETRISFEGFRADDALLAEVLALFPADLSDHFVTFTGRTPAGVSSDAILSFLSVLKERKAKIVADSRSLSLADLLFLKPYLIKPNAEEAALYLGRPLSGLSDTVSALSYFRDAGIEKAVISLGRDGAVLASSEGLFRTKIPSVPVVSTIGAGDSSIAGFLFGKMQGRSDPDALRLMSACGTAACLTPGTEPPSGPDIDAVLKKVTAEAL